MLSRTATTLNGRRGRRGERRHPNTSRKGQIPLASRAPSIIGGSFRLLDAAGSSLTITPADAHGHSGGDRRRTIARQTTGGRE
jgi:hypothetical protein